MIFYNPLDGDANTSPLPLKPRHFFLMTRLGSPVSEEVKEMRQKISELAEGHGFKIIDAASETTGRDFLLKIWKLIASCPVAIGLAHEKIPVSTQANIFYELGVAQAMAKETIVIKSAEFEIPSDFVRTEYIVFDPHFEKHFKAFLHTLNEQAKHYEDMAEQIERNPILALDYLKRAYHITGEERLRTKAAEIKSQAGFNDRAKNSVEMLAAHF